MQKLALALAIATVALTGCEDKKAAEPAKPAAASTPAASAPAAAPAESTPAAAPAASQAAFSGTYKGVLPCASCPGIDTTLIINDDGSYELTTLFLEEKDAKPETVRGKYSLNEDKTLLRLDEAGNGYVYFIGDGLLEMRDDDGTTGERNADEQANYRLKKQ